MTGEPSLPQRTANLLRGYTVDPDEQADAICAMIAAHVCTDVLALAREQEALQETRAKAGMPGPAREHAIRAAALRTAATRVADLLGPTAHDDTETTQPLHCPPAARHRPLRASMAAALRRWYRTTNPEGGHRP